MKKLSFVCCSVPTKAGLHRSWESFANYTITVNAGDTYQHIVDKYAQVKGTTKYGKVVVHELKSSSSQVDLADVPHEGSNLGFWFSEDVKKKGIKRERDCGTGAAELCADPDSLDSKLGSLPRDVKEENVTALQSPPDYSAMSHAGTHLSQSAQPAQSAQNPQLLHPLYDPTSPAYVALEEYKKHKDQLEKEGNAGGFGDQYSINGHVGFEFIEQALAAQKVVGGLSVPLTDDGGTCCVFSCKNNNKFAILTNWHVLKTTDAILSATVYMDYTENVPNKRVCELGKFSFTLRPDLMHFTCPTLDYAFVAIDPKYAPELQSRKTLKLQDISPGVARFEGVNLLSHPRGRPLTYSIRGSNILTNEHGQVTYAKIEDLIFHKAYTLRGSSGALLFDDRWKPLALHHGKGELAKTKDGVELKCDKESESGTSPYVKGVDKKEDRLFRCNRATNLRTIIRHIHTSSIESACEFVEGFLPELEELGDEV